MNASSPEPDTYTGRASRPDIKLGLLYLGLNLMISVAAQLVLKAAMLDLGSFDSHSDKGAYLLSLIDPAVIGGLILYGVGTVLWILCLSKLDLSLAYPAGTLQYLLIFAGAWWLFNEQISMLRLTGMLVICAGVFIMSVELKQT